jgi:hypothetical protein
VSSNKKQQRTQRPLDLLTPLREGEDMTVTISTMIMMDIPKLFVIANNNKDDDDGKRQQQQLPRDQAILDHIRS